MPRLLQISELKMDDKMPRLTELRIDDKMPRLSELRMDDKKKKKKWKKKGNRKYRSSTGNLKRKSSHDNSVDYNENYYITPHLCILECLLMFTTQERVVKST